jgi:hypothetical protein
VNAKAREKAEAALKKLGADPPTKQAE